MKLWIFYLTYLKRIKVANQMSSELEGYLGLFKLLQCNQKFLKSRRKRQGGAPNSTSLKMCDHSVRPEARTQYRRGYLFLYTITCFKQRTKRSLQQTWTTTKPISYPFLMMSLPLLAKYFYWRLRHKRKENNKAPYYFFIFCQTVP